MKLMLGTSQGGVQLPGEAIHMKTAEVPDGNPLYHILIQFVLAHPFPVNWRTFLCSEEVIGVSHSWILFED